MAGGAVVPSPLVRACVNGEMLRVVRQILRRHPPHIGRVAGGAIRYKIGRFVVGIVRRLEIRLVASETILWRIGKVPPDVAPCTIIYFMPFCEREKAVVNGFRFPTKIRHVVTFDAIGGKPCRLVVGVGRRLKFI